MPHGFTIYDIPDEYFQGFFKAGQSLLEALTPTSVSATDITARGPGAQLAELQLNYFQQQLALWARMMTGAGGGEPVVAPERGDRRFAAAEWRDNPAYSLLKQCYLLNSRLITDFVEASQIDEKTKHRLRFFTRQLVEAISPANFLATNPDVIKFATDTEGQSLKAGLDNLMSDLGRGSSDDHGRVGASRSARTSRHPGARSYSRTICSS